MNILIASDSYKGSLSSLQVAEKIKEGIHRVYPDAAERLMRTIKLAYQIKGT